MDSPERKRRQMSEGPAKPWFVEFPSSMILEMRGSDGLDLLQRISTNDISKLALNSWTRTVLTNDKGRMIDVLWIGKAQDDLLLLLSGTYSEQKSREWIEKFIIMENAKISASVERFSHILVVGYSDVRPENSLMRFAEEWGEASFLHLLVNENARDGTIESLMGQNAERRSIEEYEDYRISAGIPRGGHEITQEYNPLEAGLEHLISWTKGCYIGQEVIARLDTYKKVQKHLMKFTVSERISMLPARIFGPSGEIGTMTSMTQRAPFLGLGYLATKQIDAGEGMFVSAGKSRIQVTIKD